MSCRSSAPSRRSPRSAAPCGTLVNAAGALLRATATTPTATRLLTAQLDNQGTVAIDATTTFTLRGANLNPGTIALGATGTMTLAFGSGSPTFQHDGTLTIPTGRSWTTTGTGTFTMSSGSTVDGGGSYASNSGATTTLGLVPTLAALASTSGTLTVGNGVTLGGMPIALASATLNGPGTVVLAPGTSSLWRNSSISVPVALQGTLDVRGTSGLTGALTTETASILRVTGEGFSSSGIFTVANGFTNNGLLELDFVNGAGGQITQLIVSNGTLLNSATGTLRATSNTPTAGRLLNATLDNQGLLVLFPGAAGTLSLTGSLVSSGSIQSSVGGLTAGTQYGRMTVSGTALVGGTLTVGLFGGFTPVTGNTFDVITSTGLLSGSFVGATFNGVGITPSILSNAVRITAP